MFSRVTKLTWLIRFFGFAKVAMIYYCKPKVIYVDDDSLEIKIPLNRRTKNHINSMYFGALSVGPLNANIASPERFCASFRQHAKNAPGKSPQPFWFGLRIG